MKQSSGQMNKYILGGAGSGKTTFFVNEALRITEGRVLITTYTEANEEEIRRKFLQINGRIPANVTIQTWFSFLLQHWVKPFQGTYNEGLFDYEIKGMLLVNEPSGFRYYNRNLKQNVYYGEDNHFFEHYFTKNQRIFSDKIAKFGLSSNYASSNGVIQRLSKIYQYIFIDEVQDLAGYDLDIIKIMMKSSISVLLVGDPRQVTYLTHSSKKNVKYIDGKIKEFLIDHCKKLIGNNIDEDTLSKSHRNNKQICDFSAKLYPAISKLEPCTCCASIKEHQGIYFVKKNDVEKYIERFSPIQLKWSNSVEVSKAVKSMNFGECKGLTFDRVLIYPTTDMKKWLLDNSSNLQPSTRAKFYVALTRARYSAAIVLDYDQEKEYDGVIKY